MSEPSVWWAIPTRPSTWFSQDELAASDRYHGPLRRAALAREVGRLVLGLLAVVALRSGVFGGLLDGLVIRVAVISLMVAAVWWVPSALVDTWFEYRHSPSFGSTPLPVGRFAVAIASSGIGTALLVAASGGAVVALLGAIAWWPPALAAGAAAITLAEGFVGARLGGVVANIEPVEDLTVDELLDRPVADELASVRLGRIAALPGADPMGLNAFVSGWGENRQMVLSDALWDADPATKRHVVSHELAHLERRHVVVTTVASAGWEFAVVLAAGVLVANGGWFASLVNQPLGDYRSLAGLSLLVAPIRLVVGLPLAWLSRAHERRADLDALAANHTALGLIRRVHVTDRADLAPPRWVRLMAEHPGPSERLELARRSTRGRQPIETASDSRTEP